MKLEDKDTFLKHRRKQEVDYFSSIDKKNVLSSILTIELNITELCNRKCVFVRVMIKMFIRIKICI